jgi:2',3'-cyclic-nucleotide 2'-phosphodiesterase / 3'-nucleotidase
LVKIAALAEPIAGCPQGQLRIMATADLHMHLLPHDYFTDEVHPGIGLARTATLVRQLRDGWQGASVLFDNGDFLQGNPLSDYVAEPGNVAPDEAHPMIAAMHALAYDAVTLGNHEFNYGLGVLQRVLGQARFPVISANVTTSQADDPADDRTFVPPFVILKRHLSCADGIARDLRIGVIGFLPPQVAQWDKVHLGSAVGTRDILDAARAHVPRLRAAGADIVIALCHSGIGGEVAEDLMENAAVPLAAVPGIDVVIAGHTHQVFPGPMFSQTAAVDPVGGTIHGKPAVMPGFFGSHLGVVDLCLEMGGDGWKVIAHAAMAVPVAETDATGRQRATVPVDPAIAGSMRGLHRRIRSHIRRTIGETALPIHSYFAQVAPDPSIQVVADAQRAHARTVLAGRPEEALPLLVTVAPFKLGGRAGPCHYVDIPAGPLVLRHASELYLYPNNFCIIELHAGLLQDWLERTASAFLQITSGQVDQPLIDPAFPPYVFDVLDGLTCVIDPRQPPRTDLAGRVINPDSSRVSSMMIDGCPIDPESRVVVATNSYRAGGGSGFAVAAQGRIIHQSLRGIRDIVLDHIRDASPLRPLPRRSWRFASMPGTSAWFDTGPGALRYDPVQDGIASVGPAPGGFHRFSIAF